ncbi:MAG TPA: hypothetical protein VMZ73_06050 [Acidimicrobiales bacterium]|nr:hypothetical protein [Acidimicrobiales bacterium]
MTAYEDLIAEADQHQADGEWKHAHIKYGQAVSTGRSRNDYCRRMRGICSRHVAEERMQLAEDNPDRRQQYLDQAARWLAKSEANLDSAFDESPAAELGHIRIEQAKTEELMARFMEMSGDGDPSRRLSMAQAYRDEADELLAHA